MQRKDTMKGWTQEYSNIKRKKGFKVKKNRQVLLAEKLIVPTLAFEHNMTEKERKDFLKAMRTMLKLKIKQEIRPEEELMYTLTRQRELGMRKKRIKLQKVAAAAARTHVWSSFDRVIFGNGRKIHFHKKGDLKSITSGYFGASMTVKNGYFI